MTPLGREVRDSVRLFARLTWRLVVGLLLFALLMGSLWALKRVYAYHFGFDRVEWAASVAVLTTDLEADFDSPREKMVDDVAAHELRLGMSRADVLALLGPADYSDTLAWRYNAGWRAFEPNYLVIAFSQQGTVVHYSVSK